MRIAGEVVLIGAIIVLLVNSKWLNATPTPIKPKPIPVIVPPPPVGAQLSVDDIRRVIREEIAAQSAASEPEEQPRGVTADEVRQIVAEVKAEQVKAEQAKPQQQVVLSAGDCSSGACSSGAFVQRRGLFGRRR